MDRLIWLLIGFGLFYLLSKQDIDFHNIDINHLSTNTLIAIIGIIIVVLFLFTGNSGGGRGGRGGGRGRRF